MDKKIIYVDTDTHKMLKIEASKRGITIGEAIKEVLTEMKEDDLKPVV